jgi:hypothetical protein
MSIATDRLVYDLTKRGSRVLGAFSRGEARQGGRAAGTHLASNLLLSPSTLLLLSSSCLLSSYSHISHQINLRAEIWQLLEDGLPSPVLCQLETTPIRRLLVDDQPATFRGYLEPRTSLQRDRLEWQGKRQGEGEASTARGMAE